MSSGLLTETADRVTSPNQCIAIGRSFAADKIIERFGQNRGFAEDFPGRDAEKHYLLTIFRKKKATHTASQQQIKVSRGIALAYDQGIRREAPLGSGG